MAILVDMPVAKPRSERIAFRRNRIFTVCPLDVVKYLICSICLVGKNITVRQIKARQKFYSHCGIMNVSRSKQKLQWIPQCVCKGMNLGIQTTFSASYGFGLPFFTPPLALSCTLTAVEPMQIYSVSASRFRSRNIFSKIPSFCHLRNRAYTLCQFP